MLERLMSSRHRISTDNGLNLQQVEDFISVLFNSDRVLIIFKDGWGRWLRVNKFCQSLFGLEHVPYKNKTADEIDVQGPFRHSTFSSKRNHDEETWNSGNPIRSLESVSLLEGGTRTFEIMKIPTFYSDGTRKYLITVGRDITDEPYLKYPVTNVNRQKQIEAIEKCFKSVLDDTENAIALIDRKGNVIEANREFKNIFRLQTRERSIQNWRQLFSVLALNPPNHFYEKIESGNVASCEVEQEKRDGSKVKIRLLGTPVIGNDGTFAHVVLVLSHLSSEVFIEEKVHLGEEAFHTFAENSSDVIAVLNHDGIITYANQTVQKTFGYKHKEFVEKSIFDMIHPSEVQRLRILFSSLRSGDHRAIPIEVRTCHSSGNWVNCRIVVQNLFLGKGQSKILLNISEITEQKSTKERMKHLAFYDQLTGLLNRKGFQHHLTTQIHGAEKRSEPLSVVYIDIDRFKFVNAAFDFTVGDKILLEVARRITQSLPPNAKCSRFGEDELALTLSKSDIEETAGIADELLEVLREPFVIDDYTFHMTVSIGISTYPADGNDGTTLLRSANMALYRAKRLGGDQYQISTPTANIETYKQFLLQNDLPKAIAEEQLRIHYQPRVNPHTGQITSAEALIRWKHPDWGLVLPNEFIPLAEKTGLIVSIGDWVLRKVCVQIRTWHEEGLTSIPVSVNISGRQLMQNNFIKTVCDTLQSVGLDGNQLELEVTERVFLQNEKSIAESIDSLKKLGVKVSLDDFGTGYSSINHVKRFNFDAVKIDKSFLQDIETDSGSSMILKTVIQLVRGLNMNVVVEGVETKSQLAFVQREECNEIQGYLASRPLPVKEFTQLLQKGKCMLADEPDSGSNRRKYYRLSLTYPLSSNMTIKSIKGKDVQLGSTPVLIWDIGPGGLCFMSKITLPVNPDIMLQFDTEIFQRVSFKGHVAWSQNVKDGLYKYGFQYQINESERSKLVKILNQLSIELRKHPIVPNCRFVKGNMG